MNDDLISRQAVLDGLASIAKAKAKSDAQKSLIGRVMFFTEHLPSVNPQEPKAGHWINIINKDLHDYRTGNKLCFECSECRSQYTYKSNYCPNCGCRMFEPQERSE